MSFRRNVGTGRVRRPVLPLPAGLAVGLKGFSGANYYASAVGEGVDGAASGFWIAVLFRLDGLPAGDWKLFANGNGGGSSNGWTLRATSAPDMRMTAANGSGSRVLSPAKSLGSGDVGKVHLILGVHDATHLRLYFNDVEQGSGTAITGYTGLAGSRQHTVGVRLDKGQPATGATILGAAAGLGVPSASERSDFLTGIQAARDLITIPGKTDSHYSVRQSASLVPPEWVDLVGAANLDRTGTPTAESFTAEFGS